MAMGKHLEKYLKKNGMEQDSECELEMEAEHEKPADDDMSIKDAAKGGRGRYVAS